MDKDAQMLKRMGTALTELQVRYRSVSLPDRVIMKPSLDGLTSEYANYQLKLIEEGVISTDADLKEMVGIESAIKKAADAQELLAAIIRTAAFVATKL